MAANRYRTGGRPPYNAGCPESLLGRVCCRPSIPTVPYDRVLEMNRRVFVVAMCVALASLWLVPPQAHSAPRFGIGSEAPALDIEHWVQDGGGQFKPVTEFEDGKIYVVEFWATWCGPCIMSMPHLAELQTKYRDQDVRIISISDESLDEVKDLLAQENPQVGKTFDEITSPYSLTADPDRSVHTEYMEAAGVNGIPSAFLVGKTGKVEWIGHPAELEEPIEAVLNDSWDREEAQFEWERQKALEEMSMLARRGRFDDALAIVTQQRDAAVKIGNEEIAEYWLSVSHSLKLSAGKIDDVVINYYRGKIAEMKQSPRDLFRFSFSIYGVFNDGGEVGPLASDAISAVEAIKDQVAEDELPLFHHCLALLNEVDGNLTVAVEQQRKAVEVATGPQKERLQQMLELFEADLERAEKAAEKTAEESSSDDSDGDVAAEKE